MKYQLTEEKSQGPSIKYNYSKSCEIANANSYTILRSPFLRNSKRKKKSKQFNAISKILIILFFSFW